MEIKNKLSLFEFTGKVGIKEVIPLGLQHVVAMVVGCVTPALIVATIAGLNFQDKIILVQSSLVFSGIATLIQIFPLFKRIGSRLPVIMGASFAYVPILSSLAGEFNIAAIFGAQIIGGLVAIIFGLFSKKLIKFFPEIVTGTVIFSIGLSLYETAINYMAGGAGSESFGSPLNWLVAILTLSIVVFLNFFTKGSIKLASILIAIVIGYIISLFLGMVSFEGLDTARWFQVPKFLYFGLEFRTTAIVSMIIMHIVNSVQAIGDISATTGGAMDRVPTEKEISGVIVGNGFSSILGALFGCVPTATYSQNVGIVTMNKVINRSIFIFASIIIIISGLIPKISSVLVSIPKCVLGGATIYVFATITMTGVRMIANSGLTSRNVAIVGLAIALGVGISQVNGALGLFPGWFISIFGSSSIIVTTLVAILLNIILPKDENKKNND